MKRCAKTVIILGLTRGKTRLITDGCRESIGLMGLVTCFQ